MHRRPRASQAPPREHDPLPRRQNLAADADDDAKADFLEIIDHAPFADRLEEAVRKDPALADLTNDKGQRAIDLACLECRSAMQKPSSSSAATTSTKARRSTGPRRRSSCAPSTTRRPTITGSCLTRFDKDGRNIGRHRARLVLAAKLGTNVEILKLEDGAKLRRTRSSQSASGSSARSARSSSRSFRSRSSGATRRRPATINSSTRATSCRRSRRPRTTNLQMRSARRISSAKASAVLDLAPSLWTRPTETCSRSTSRSGRI